MDGSMHFSGIISPITLPLAFVSPALTAILIGFLWFRRPRVPAVLPGIPLALLSIALQVLPGTIGILSAFQKISTRRQAGLKNVGEALADATGSIPIAIALSIGCIVALMIFQIICDRRDEQTEWNEPKDKPTHRIVFILSAISALATMALLWFFERTLDIICVIVDPARLSEAKPILNQISMGGAAAMISQRLLLGAALSLVLAAAFLCAPLLLLVGEVSDWVRTQSWTFAIMTVVCLILFGITYHNQILYMISLTQR